MYLIKNVSKVADRCNAIQVQSSTAVSLSQHRLKPGSGVSPLQWQITSHFSFLV